MKRKVVLIIFSIVVLILLDCLIGLLFSYLYHKAQYGQIARQNHCIIESTDDIIIVGSSEVMRNYDPAVIQDSLKLTCYTNGSEGQCIYYSYAIIRAIIERNHFPKFLICDIGNYDVLESDDSQNNIDAAISRLLPNYYDSKAIRSVINDYDHTQRIKCLSSAYRYNSKIIQIVKCLLYNTSDYNGFEPNNKKLDLQSEKEELLTTTEVEFRKIDCIKQTIELAKEHGVVIIFVHSPKYYVSDNKGVNMIDDICREEGVIFWDFDSLDCFNNPSLFADRHHLNKDGAAVLSRELYGRISQLNQ
jgi:hypothetical protein